LKSVVSANVVDGNCFPLGIKSEAGGNKQEKYQRLFTIHVVDFGYLRADMETEYAKGVVFLFLEMTLIPYGKCHKRCPGL